MISVEQSFFMRYSAVFHLTPKRNVIGRLSPCVWASNAV